jgi:1,5-anhydro-D-fructose reductase (1,5-anhydro-D-mannitol-forming)
MAGDQRLARARADWAPARSGWQRFGTCQERKLVDSQTLGWGIVGLGNIASGQIAPAIAACRNCTLAAVTSRDQGRAEEFAHKHGAAHAYDDYANMLADPDVQIVYIATPNALHAEQVVAAAKAGKHVLCDKPLATNVPDAQRAVDECRNAGVRLGVMFQTRNHDGLAEAAELVRSGGIGKVVVAEVEMSAGRNLPKGWRTDPGLAGLGTLNNIGVHAFDVLRYLLGSEVTEVVALVDSEPGFDVDTTALALLRFASGALAYVNANQSVPNQRDDIVIYGSEGRIVGSNLSRPARDGTLSLISREGTREFAASSHDAYRHTVDAFAHAVLHGHDPSPSGEDGLRSVELSAAIAESIREHRVVALPA